MLPNCVRCGEEGHWAEHCPWNQPAASRAEHRARIAGILRRWENWETTGMTTALKRRLIKEELELWDERQATAKTR